MRQAVMNPFHLGALEFIPLAIVNRKTCVPQSHMGTRVGTNIVNVMMSLYLVLLHNYVGIWTQDKHISGC